MNFILNLRSFNSRTEHWTEQHHSKWLDYLRMLLGAVLIAKGISYIIDRQEVMEMISRRDYWVIHFAVAHYVIGGSIACGILIIAGLFFRIAVLFEIPALIGSIIYIDLHKNFFEINSELAYSIIILALLVFFFFYGAGRISADFYLRVKGNKS